MDQCEGQMDVFEVNEDIKAFGLLANPPKRIVAGDFKDIEKLSLRPLWDRGSSPKP